MLKLACVHQSKNAGQNWSTNGEICLNGARGLGNLHGMNYRQVKLVLDVKNFKLI